MLATIKRHRSVGRAVRLALEGKKAPLTRYVRVRGPTCSCSVFPPYFELPNATRSICKQRVTGENVNSEIRLISNNFTQKLSFRTHKFAIIHIRIVLVLRVKKDIPQFIRSLEHPRISTSHRRHSR